MTSFVTPRPQRRDVQADTLGNAINTSEQLYHVALTIGHLSKDPNGIVERMQIVGTYATVVASKVAAHRVLFELGYENGMFDVYETQPAELEKRNVRDRDGLIVHAEAQDGTIFQVRILTEPNDLQLATEEDDKRITIDLWHVVQTQVCYLGGEEGQRSYNLEGTFTNIKDAVNLAKKVLLSSEDGLSKSSYAQYDEAEGNEADCGYEENVIVHAVGQNGNNVEVKVVKGQTPESVKLAEAAARIS